MTQDSQAIVRVEGLVKDFRPGFGVRRVRVLHGISFEVARGEIFGFIGPNGAGKTTTLKVLMGLIRASAGSAQVLGHDVRETAFRERVGFAPESPYFYDFLSGRETLDFYARLSGVAALGRADRVALVLEKVGLAHAADDRLRTYSKGMLQRIAIAQALVHDPSVLFLDEPMSGLDPVGRKEIRDLIVDLHADGKTIFMNTHILSDVEMICDRVAIIAKGRIVYEGNVDGVYGEHERRTDVTASGLTPEFADEAETRFDAVLSGRGERITLRVPEKRGNELIEAVLARGGTVHEVLPVRTSLESVFLHAVEPGSEEEAEQ